MAADEVVPTVPQVVVHNDDTSVAVIVARLEGTINTNFAIIRGDIKETRGIADDHEKRIRDVEKTYVTKSDLTKLEAAVTALNAFRWKLVGFTSAVSAGVGFGAAFLATYLTSRH